MGHRLGFAVALLVAARVAPALDEDGAAIVATVDGSPIVRRDVEEGLRATRTEALVSPERLLQAQAAVLERLVEQRLLKLAIERAGIAVDPADVDAAVAQVREQVGSQGQQFDLFLARSGRDEATLRRQIELDLAAKKLVEPRATDPALTSFIESNRREHDGTLLRASHIVLRPDVGSGDETIAACIERAERIRREILSGDISFAAAAERYSAGPSRHSGGDIGYLPRHSVCREEFAGQLFALAKGEISRPFATPFGIHLVTVTAVQPGREPVAGLRDRLRPQFVAKLIRDAIVEQWGLRKVEYAAGVPHFDRSQPEGRPSPRRIIVTAAEPP